MLKIAIIDNLTVAWRLSPQGIGDLYADGHHLQDDSLALRLTYVISSMTTVSTNTCIMITWQIATLRLSSCVHCALLSKWPSQVSLNWF